MKAVIMAGGKGTRIASVAADVPKPMIPVLGKPVLEYQLDCLKKNGLTDIIMVVGHLGDAIKNHFADGDKFGCHISYYTETEPLGTAGALLKLYDTLPADFILINGDLIFDIDFSRIIKFHEQKNALVTLTVHPNSHPYDSALIISDGEDRVIRWLNKEDPRAYYKNRVNAGIHIIRKDAFRMLTYISEKVDLDREILKPLIRHGSVFVYSTPEYIMDVGTPDRYETVTVDIKKGLPKARNLLSPQKAVFLDRDGTINKFNGFITRQEDFELIPGAAEAVRTINKEGYLAIVITNQPVIARGECTLEELDAIHNKMETELGKEGAFINDIFFCPHHPDRGFSGERVEYKIDCDCRKPKPGLIFQAAKKYNIDLASSYMAGDDERDMEAGRAAGCKTVLLGADKKETNAVTNIYSDLNQFARTLHDE